MDETMTMEVGTTDSGEIELTAFDEGWGDGSADADSDEMDLSGEESETTDAQPEEEDSADGTTEAEPDGEKSDKAADEAKPENKESDEGHQLFTLKFLGEEKTVTRDEVIQLAQKGANYDHVVTDRDTLREENAKLKPYESFLKELADNSKTDIPTLMETTRAHLLMNKAEAEGKEMTEEQAIRQIRLDAREAEIAAKEAAESEKKQAEQPEETKEEKQQKAFAAFLAEYPEVDPNSIPQEVWAEYNTTGDLLSAYRKHEIKQLRLENEQLKQNEKNKQRSTGSRRSAGATTPKDAFDEGWDSF